MASREAAAAAPWRRRDPHPVWLAIGVDPPDVDPPGQLPITNYGDSELNSVTQLRNCGSITVTVHSIAIACDYGDSALN